MPRGGKRHESARGYRRGFKKKKHHVSKAAVAKVVKEILKPELKFLDFPQSKANLTVGVQEIDAAEGDYDILEGTGTRGERIGKKVLLEKIFWRFNIRADVDSTAAASETIRLLIILDKQVNGAATPGSLVFDDVTNWATYNGLLDVGRFRTLYDSGPIDLMKTAAAGNGTTNLFAGESHTEEVFLKNLGIELIFDASTGAISDLTVRHVSFWALARVGGQARVVSEVRLRYTDV